MAEGDETLEAVGVQHPGRVSVRAQRLKAARVLHPGFHRADQRKAAGGWCRGHREQIVVPARADAGGGARCEAARTVRFQPLPTLVAHGRGLYGRPRLRGGFRRSPAPPRSGRRAWGGRDGRRCRSRSASSARTCSLPPGRSERQPRFAGLGQHRPARGEPPITTSDTSSQSARLSTRGWGLAASRARLPPGGSWRGMVFPLRRSSSSCSRASREAPSSPRLRQPSSCRFTRARRARIASIGSTSSGAAQAAGHRGPAPLEHRGLGHRVGQVLPDVLGHVAEHRGDQPRQPFHH